MTYDIGCLDCGYMAHDTNSKGACKGCGGNNFIEDKSEIGKMAKVKVYSFSTTRNKNGERGWSINHQKEELSLLYGKKCHKCRDDFPLGKLQLDHIIPVICCGNIFDIDNLQLLCLNCHKKKTIIDVRIINCLKKLKILGKCVLFLDPNIVHKIYSSLFILGNLAENNSKSWEEYCPHIEKKYEQVLYKENRIINKEVKKDGGAKTIQ